jgi:hypothetical protein
VVETVTLVSSSEDSTKVAAVKPMEGSGSAEERNQVDGSTSDKKTSAAASVNISAESSHTTNEKIHAASEKQSSCIIRQEGIEKVGTLLAFLGFCCCIVVVSVADPDPGSGIGCFLTPGSGMGES